MVRPCVPTGHREAPGLFHPASQMKWPIRGWLVIVVVTSLAITSIAAEVDEIDAEVWRVKQLSAIAEKLRQAKSDAERLEHAARKSWLHRWKPGRMPHAPKQALTPSSLVQEPLLEELQRPDEIEPGSWQQMIDLQTRLHTVDTDGGRKANLRTIIKLAAKFEKVLSVQLPPVSQKLPSRTGWVLAFTRYRLGRALAYRELPVLKGRWPISKPDEDQKQLTAVFKKLTDQTIQTRPEFILLHDRMLRRSGSKGRALELLELHRQSIKPKWYLKKRRDLLKELGWAPPHQEAARLYLEAGYDDEPSPDKAPTLKP